ncbi:hypothetical protein CARUB_v10019515mg [Capsella rubella]|uniref:Uncharacterized protein n=1 Tax=Capsella rubella TaxID=81985 RepID=R0HQ70_9BRAS|nr:hypothetical protein CARUB_v10019515mg [Capsella rubella]
MSSFHKKLCLFQNILVSCASFHQSRSCFIGPVMLHVSSLTGQLMAVLVMFSKEKQSISLLILPWNPREAKSFVRMDCAVFMVMILL